MMPSVSLNQRLKDIQTDLNLKWSNIASTKPSITSLELSLQQFKSEESLAEHQENIVLDPIFQYLFILSTKEISIITYPKPQSTISHTNFYFTILQAYLPQQSLPNLANSGLPIPHRLVAYNINIITTMSNILRTKNGNLSKVKYFLPGARGQPDEASSLTIHNKTKQSRSVTKKHSNPLHHHNQSVASNGDISFQIVGIHENSNIQVENHDFTRTSNPLHRIDGKINIENGFEKMRSCNGEKMIQASLSSIRALTNSREWALPQGSEKEQFYRFIQTLKDDQTYQHTVTMFTIMYFYQQRRKKSVR